MSRRSSLAPPHSSAPETVPVSLFLGARVLLPLLLLLGIAACSTAPTPATVTVQGTDPALIEDVQPPTLPIEPATDPLPRIPGNVPVEPTLNASAALSSKVQMRLLLISPTADDPGLEALKALCDQVGALCDTFISSTTPLTRNVLEDTSKSEGKYQGIFLTDNQLAYNSGGSWAVSFDADEWNTLWEYERDYSVRQVSLFTYPGSYPEPQGLTYEGNAPGTAPSTGKAYYNASLTADGQDVFSSLKANAPIPIHFAYTYLAKLDPTISSAKPLLQDSSGNVLAATSTSPDGRERLALSMAQAPFLLHSQLLTYDLMRWVTKGVFIGQRQFYLGIDQDDFFVPTDKWDATVGGINGQYRLTAQDVAGLVAQQNKLRSAYPFAKDFAWTIAFNGSYANESAPSDCSAAPGGPDPLTSAALCYKGEFFWLNHTWTHAFMDKTNYATSFSEIDLNTKLAQRLGLTTSKYGFNSLVTGDISGLGWYAPNGPDTGPKVDFGLNASNPEFLKAAADAGVRYLASNMSVTSQEPVNCWGCGITHPLNSDIFLIPRWPTNLFFSPTTPVDMMDAYNRVYGPSGSSPYFDKNLTYDEYLDVEAEISLFHVISGSPYQHYQHVGNLREYASGRSLAYDWVERLLSQYSRYYNKPLKTLDWKTLSETVAKRTSFRKAGLSGVLDMAAKTVTITSANGGTLYFTHGSSATIVTDSLGVGQSKTFNVSYDYSAPKNAQEITFTSAAPTNATVGGSYTVSATASSGLAVSFASTTTDVCTVSGSTVNFVAAGACTVDASQAGNETYNPAPNVNQTFAITAAPVVKQNQTITFTSSAPTNATVGGSYTVSATASSGLAVSFASTTTDVCTVSGSTVNFVAAGACTVDASQAGNETYNPAPNVNQTFAVAAAPVVKQNQTITFTSSAPTSATVGGSYTVSATASSGLAVSFRTANPNRCTVSGSTVNFIARGRCTIRALQAGDASYNAAPTVSQSFAIQAVVKQNQTVTFTSSAPTNATVGGSYTVSATASSGLAVSFRTANPNRCTVSGSTVNFIARGRCTIRALQAGDASYKAAPRVSQSFTVRR